ncbi:hypothetical protein EOA31_32440, partial [Mesorhizobium sp. M4B.F.Ca.ET.049.02.1.2]
PSISVAQVTPVARPSPRDAYADHIAEASRRFGVPIATIRAVMRAESAGEPRAVSSAGAMSLMQIMPATWAPISRRSSESGKRAATARPASPPTSGSRPRS